MSKLIVFLVLLAVYSGITLAQHAEEILSKVTIHYSQVVNGYECTRSAGLTSQQCGQ